MAANAGAGLLLQPEVLVAGDLASGTLEQVLALRLTEATLPAFSTAAQTK
jgi:hypothetical protein